MRMIPINSGKLKIETFTTDAATEGLIMTVSPYLLTFLSLLIALGSTRYWDPFEEVVRVILTYVTSLSSHSAVSLLGLTLLSQFKMANNSGSGSFQEEHLEDQFLVSPRLDSKPILP